MRWKLCSDDPKTRAELVSRLEVSPFLARILVNRGIREPGEAREFLWPHLDHLLDPYLMKDMDRAVDRILEAVRRREKVVIYGDYDVDGVTATALLLRFLRFLGLEPVSYIPCRLEEGYSFNFEAVDRIARMAANLVISVDNGTGSLEEIAALRSRGIDVIVTDHHEPGGDLPDASAILNPKRHDCDYPFKLLAGVGVAFKLALAVTQRLLPERRESPEFRSLMLEALALVSLGTVADVVPLVRENRVLAKHGLRGMPEVKSPGIQALLRMTRGANRTVEPVDVAFRIGPRLNAAGRMGKVEIALDLLTTDSRSLALAAGNRLEEENTRRQEIERGIVEECRTRLRATDSIPAGIVLGDEGWHRGVIGIVAAKIAEEFHRPTILVAFDARGGRGSARSIPGVNLLEAVRACSEHLGSFGGHAHAAGLDIERSRLPDFARDFAAAVTRAGADLPSGPSLTIDAELGFGSISRSLLTDLDRLAPHGERNPEPVFVAEGVRIAGPPRTMGRTGDHLQLHLHQGGAALRAVGFRMGSFLDSLHDGGAIDIAFTPRLNRWNGRETLEVLLHDIRA